MPRERMNALYQQARRAAIWGVALSLILGVAKFAGGWLGHSIALTSDAVHSFGDALTAAAVWGSLLWAQRPADREHPYGHTRAEAVAGSNVALLLVLSGLGIAWEALTTLSEPSPRPELFTIAIAAVSMVLKEGLYRFQSRVARATGSGAVRAAAWDHRLDALGSAAVLVGLSLSYWGGPAFHPADRIAAVAVAAVVLWAGGHLLWISVQELMDRQAEPEVLDAVRREASAVPGVRGVEKVLARKSGLEYLVDIHIEVDPESSVREGHAVGHSVKDRLMGRIATIKDVLVHIEPSPHSKPGERPA
ncbi:MAG TPA: cation diffusion facilitator family transporter [Gemmataceae bacterium]|nr:cation diffusion facilitator family transporter [Gemmataceae bacterium]